MSSSPRALILMLKERLAGLSCLLGPYQPRFYDTEIEEQPALLGLFHRLQRKHWRADLYGASFYCADYFVWIHLTAEIDTFWPRLQATYIRAFGIGAKPPDFETEYGQTEWVACGSAAEACDRAVEMLVDIVLAPRPDLFGAGPPWLAHVRGFCPDRQTYKPE